MAGEYYRWLARNERPEEKREMTPAEKRRNWWDYHKWHLALGLLCLVLVWSVISDALENSRNQPDYQIAFVGSTALPQDTRLALEQAIAGLGEDLNGNGKVQVEILEFQLNGETGGGNPMDMQRDAEMAYNASMLLLVNVETAQSMIYLLEDPELFQASYPILTRVDGSDPELTPDSEAPMWYRWADCPVLAELELGTFEIPVVGGNAVGDSQKAMENICIARRGLWDDGSNETIEGALRLWKTLTEGAK